MLAGKTILSALIGAVVVIASCMNVPAADAPATNALPATSPAVSDVDLIRFAQQRTNAVRVTREPMQMQFRSAELCSIAPEEAQTRVKSQLPGQNPHREKFVHVYVTK